MEDACVFLNLVSTRNLRNWAYQTYAVVWADPDFRQFVTLGDSNGSCDSEWNVELALPVTKHLQDVEFVTVEIYTRSCLSHELLGTVRVPFKDFARGISERMYDIIDLLGNVEGKLIIAARVEGSFRNRNSEIVDAKGRTASWVESLNDLETDASSYPVSEEASLCTMVAKEKSQKPDEASDKDANPAYSTTSYTRTNSCSSEVECTDDGSSSQQDNFKSRSRSTSSSGHALLQVWPCPQPAEQNSSPATMESPFPGLSVRSHRGSSLQSPKRKSSRYKQTIKDGQKVQATEAGLTQKQGYKWNVSTGTKEVKQQETVSNGQQAETKGGSSAGDADPEVKTRLTEVDSFQELAIKAETFSNDAGKAKGSSAGISEGCPSASLSMSAVVDQQQADQMKLEDQHPQMEGSSSLFALHSKETRHGGSFSYQKQESSVVVTGRSKSLQANAGSLVASRVKQFEEMMQPSKVLQKQRWEAMMNKASEKKGNKEEEKTESVSREASLENEATTAAAAIHASGDDGQSQMCLSKFTDHQEEQQQPDFSTTELLIEQPSIRPIQTSDENEGAVSVEREIMRVKKQCGKRQEETQQAGRKSKGWWACTCNLGRFCCCTCYTAQL